MSGHSVPISTTWLADGIAHFTNPQVVGVYGNVWAHADAGFWEKMLFNAWLGRRQIARGYTQEIRTQKMGVLGFTNAIIRRDLWEQYPIDEAYANGGEDGAWARYWLARGYVCIQDARFSVYHSHDLGLWGLLQQYKHWYDVAKPQPCMPRTYRK